MTDDTHGGMPPKRYTRPKNSVQIQRKLVDSTGSRQYGQLPQFEVGSNSLWIFVNGKKEMVELDYVEESSTSIVFKKEIPRGAVIEFLVLT